MYTENGITRETACAITVDQPTCTIRFDANGGGGQMASVTLKEGEVYVLPPCTLTPPEGFAFHGWRINDLLYQPGDSVTAQTSLAIAPEWVPLPAPTPEPDAQVPQTGDAAPLALWSALAFLSLVNNSAAHYHNSVLS